MRNGLTCGGSVIAVIRNTDTRSGDYAALDGKPRPSHADYPAMVKFGSAIDRRGGGQFSGRLTAPLVIAGGIVLPLLERKGIHIAAHIASIGNVRDAAFDPLEDEPELMEKLNRMPFAVIDENAGESMRTCIRACAADGDSIGGTIECKVTGSRPASALPCSTESKMRFPALFSPFRPLRESNSASVLTAPPCAGPNTTTPTITIKTGMCAHATIMPAVSAAAWLPGMPVIFRVCVKPTPSISREQDTVDMNTHENVKIAIHGRHDPCIVPRAVSVIRAVTALALYELTDLEV